MATARELIRALWENCPYDARHSSDPESGWNFTGLSGDSYVSMNLLGRSQRPKYVYCVKKSRGNCHVFVSLIVNNRNPHCEKLKKKAEELGDVYVNDDSEDGDFEVRRKSFSLRDLSLEEAQELACDKLSELYRDYNEMAFVRADGKPADYVNDGRVVDLAKKRESQSQVQQDLTLCPVNWTEYRDFWDDFVKNGLTKKPTPTMT